MTTKKIARTKRGTKQAAETPLPEGEIRRAAERAGLAPTAEDIRSDIYMAEHFLATAADCMLASTNPEASKPLSQAQMALSALHNLRSARSVLVDAAERVMYIGGES